MLKTKNIAVLFTVLTALGLSGDVWGMNPNEEKIDVVYNLVPRDKKLYLYALDTSLAENTLEKFQGVEQTVISLNQVNYTAYIQEKGPENASWVEIGEVTLTDGIYALKEKKVLKTKNAQFNNSVNTLIEQKDCGTFLQTLANFFVTEEPDPVVLVQVTGKTDWRTVSVLVKKSVTSGVKATTPTAAELDKIIHEKISATDNNGNLITNIYKFDNEIPEGYELVRVGSYNNTYFAHDATTNQSFTYQNEISGDKFQEKVEAFVGSNIKTNIQKYLNPTEKDIEEEQIKYKQQETPVEQINKNVVIPTLTSPLATIVYSTLSSLCGLFWGTIQSYIGTHRIKTELTTLALTGASTAFLMNKTIADKRADRRWMFGTAVVSHLIASQCGNRVVNATCRAIKKCWAKKR